MLPSGPTKFYSIIGGLSTVMSVFVVFIVIGPSPLVLESVGVVGLVSSLIEVGGPSTLVLRLVGATSLRVVGPLVS